MLLLAFEFVTKGNCFKLDPDGVHDRNHWPRFKYKGRQHRAELVNRQRIVAIQQHIPAPVPHSYDEHLDLEVVGALSIE
jgi:hypothetical protein